MIIEINMKMIRFKTPKDKSDAFAILKLNGYCGTSGKHITDFNIPFSACKILDDAKIPYQVILP